ncbi:MAG: hypothetical protein ABIA63_09640 [bacterium]
MAKNIIIILIFPAIFAGICFGAAQILLESYASSFDPIPVVVVKFKNPQCLENIKEPPWQIIADDFEFSGRFSVLRIDTDEPAVPAGMLLMVIGEFYILDDTINIKFRLIEPTGGLVIYECDMHGQVKTAGRLAHRFSNLAYRMIFGETGIFESRICCVRGLGTKRDIHVMDYDGKDNTQLTRNQTLNLFPCFIDKESLIWVSYVMGKPDLFKGAVGKIEKPFILSPHTETSPDATRAGDCIAFASSMSGNLEIYICNADGTGRKQLTYNKAVDTAPSWSPDGRHLAFVSDRMGGPQIYLMDEEGSNVKRITFMGNYQDSPAWSPRGDLIAYTSLQNRKYDIWVVKPDGEDSRQVTSMSGSNEYPAWSPNGSHILFQSGLGGSYDLYSVRPDGTGLKRMTFTGDVRMPGWSPF